jgi:basic membrane protein A and related proteins
MRQKKRLLSAVAIVAALGLVATACGDDNDEASGSDTTASAGSDTTAGAGADTSAGGAASDTLACQVTDVGGIDDKGFNQIAFEGLQQAESELGVAIEFLESKTEADYAPNIQSFLDKSCDVIITVGFLLDSATAEAAKNNPDIQFAIVDSSAMDNNGTPDDFSDDIALPNVRPLNFSTDQPSFLAGYLAAGMSESGVVGTYGGINIPPVTIFMEGFRLGVDHYNTVKGTDVKVLGWDGTDGTFAGNFDKVDDGKRIAQSQADEGADIIFPVAGPVGLGSAQYALESDGAVKIIGVDVDQYVSAPEYAAVYLSSVLKKIDASVLDTVRNVVETGAPGAAYLGTLENGGVGLGEFHDFDSAVSDELKAELVQLQADIIAGTIKTSAG